MVNYKIIVGEEVIRVKGDNYILNNESGSLTIVKEIRGVDEGMAIFLKWDYMIRE